jgi:thymidylate kinase
VTREAQPPAAPLLQLSRADVCALAPLWTRMALAVSAHRYLYSDLVYAPLQLGIERAQLAQAYVRAGLLEPSLVLFFEASPELALQRLRARGTPLHAWESAEQQRAVRRGYAEVFAERPLGWSCPVHAIDAALEPAQVAECALAILDAHADAAVRG